MLKIHLAIKKIFKIKVNGQSLLGVKLSEAQSYLIKASDYVHMVICDGFNITPKNGQFTKSEVNNEISSNQQLTTSSNGISVSASPFPRLPPQPPLRQSNNINNNSNSLYDTPGNLNSFQLTNGIPKINGHYDSNINTDHPDFVNNKHKAPGKLPLSMSNNCNYDNLRNIDSDESRLTSPDVANNYIFNTNGNSKMVNSVSFNASNGSTLNGKLKSTPINSTSMLSNLQQQQNSSLPISDKNIMSNIMNKSLNPNDPKSQSMFTANTNSNTNSNSVNNSTPVAPVCYIFMFFCLYFISIKCFFF